MKADTSTCSSILTRNSTDVLNQQRAYTPATVERNNRDYPKPRSKGDSPTAVQSSRPFMQASRTRTSASGLSGPGTTAEMWISRPSCSSKYETMVQSCRRIHTVVVRLPSAMKASAPRRCFGDKSWRRGGEGVQFE